jgi:hypothetical protein
MTVSGVPTQRAQRREAMKKPDYYLVDIDGDLQRGYRFEIVGSWFDSWAEEDRNMVLLKTVYESEVYPNWVLASDAADRKLAEFEA